MGNEPSYLRIRNWDRYQVYKDGRPLKFVALWISTDEEHTGILDNPTFMALANDPGCPVFRLLALAGRLHNKIPNDPEWLKGALHLDRKVDIAKMMTARFLEAHPDSKVPANKARTDPYESVPEVKVSEVKRKDLSSPNGDRAEVVEIFEHWQHARDKGRSRLTPNRRRCIKARLGSFSADELIRAITAVALDPWEDRPRHDDLTILLRNDEQVEKFLALADDPAVLSAEERRQRHLLDLKERGVA